MTTQFPIQFEFQIKSFGNFYAIANIELVKQLKQCVAIAEPRWIVLAGESGYGKSHLLQACCQQASGIGISAFYYPFSHQLPSVELFEGLEQFELICFDDIHHGIGAFYWERSFLDFLNRYSGRLILSTLLSDLKLPFHSQLLSKKLSHFKRLIFETLSTEEMVSIFIQQAYYRGLCISPQVGHYLLKNYAFDLTGLWILLEQLDKAGLSAKHKLTIPFIKRILDN